MKVNIHQLSYGYVAWRVTVICFIVFNLTQVLYLVGVGLFLIIDLLAFTYSQGMFYHNSSLIPKCNSTYQKLSKIHPHL